MVPKFITREILFFDGGARRRKGRPRTAAGSGCGLRPLRWTLGALRSSTALSSYQTALLHELSTNADFPLVLCPAHATDDAYIGKKKEFLKSYIRILYYNA